ncbi:MAG: SDR family NAD(P)-dependent oxidoreductase [Sphingomonadales bacterium]|nr:SDR family NAD(P)-dependent oxidoreductase [Sphingomonadales bacterium]
MIDAAFRDRYGPRALVLGGSEGIGAAFADALARRGLDLTLVARRAPPLEEQAERLRARHGVAVDVVGLDLADEGVEQAAATLIARHDYGLLIYNAGAAHGAGLFADRALAGELGLVRLNCLGSVAFTHHALARMRPRGKGGVILVSSMSGLAGSGFLATYAAAKSFEIVLAEGLHWEHAAMGIDVMCAIASLTDTPAMRASGMKFDAIPGMAAMDPGAVAEGALAHLGQGPVWCASGQAALDAARGTNRDVLIDTVSRMGAALYELEPAPPLR